MTIHFAFGPNNFPACKRAMRAGNFSTSHTVAGKAFKRVAPEEACHYCKSVFLKLRNGQRASKGLPPVERYNSPTPETGR